MIDQKYQVIIFPILIFCLLSIFGLSWLATSIITVVAFLAADKAIDGEDRFKGKPVVRIKLGQAVSNGEAVIEKIVQALEKRKQS